jgi:hypothetical protein
MASSDERLPIVIAGGGCVGLFLALLLCRADERNKVIVSWLFLVSVSFFSNVSSLILPTLRIPVPPLFLSLNVSQPTILFYNSQLCL